ncbi:hypothetical protein TCAL_16299 [Tigriopus californicus]|uniref:Uncharacterized protein n=1 Tax=Tigriopus californicus TaxID=6832 RepID=A0A553N7H9_TIGCA|nr:hypothetical protein TCAL_16299 [Tigriopus californicus]
MGRFQTRIKRAIDRKDFSVSSTSSLSKTMFARQLVQGTCKEPV